MLLLVNLGGVRQRDLAIEDDAVFLGRLHTVWITFKPGLCLGVAFE